MDVPGLLLDVHLVVLLVLLDQAGVGGVFDPSVRVIDLVTFEVDLSLTEGVGLERFLDEGGCLRPNDLPVVGIFLVKLLLLLLGEVGGGGVGGGRRFEIVALCVFAVWEKTISIGRELNIFF